MMSELNAVSVYSNLFSGPRTKFDNLQRATVTCGLGYSFLLLCNSFFAYPSRALKERCHAKDDDLLDHI